ncbi:MAG TPA: O-antigen ligase family protein [Candidatus Limnocylindrales bacterium]|nr:O-antigen ligase family protein [Candidatus Limnocylindrales bacterium]
MKYINYLNRAIEYSFYALFLFVPLVFTGATSELFEFPKMWLTFVITIIIVTSWITKMILQGKIHIQRTPLDIPLILFLSSQIVSTIFSLDPHVSLWGFYSRFNGGLLSIISYIFLYYAFVSNLSLKQVLNTLKVGLFAGSLVALWGLPSHFGIDPTCYVFRGSFDTSCWTEAFRPTIRIFSTLGQPAWLAAYFSALIPLSIAYALSYSQNNKLTLAIQNKKFIGYLILAFMFYAGLTYTDTRGGFLGFWIANLLFWVIAYYKKILSRKNFFQYFLLINLTFIIFNFFQGVPISQISRFTYPELTKSSSTISTDPVFKPAAGALGGTDSGKIRLLVWKGAIDGWIDHPIIGTGVETFAYAYYKYRPPEHNLTSEWDFLYNKAHNEYLNYLTTTGILGLGSYLAFISLFIFQTGKWLVAYSKQKKTNEKAEDQTPESISHMLILGLFAGWISILISNFFGFSVVIINLYLFIIPAFVFILGNFLNLEKSFSFSLSPFRPANSSHAKLNRYQITLLIGMSLTSALLLFSLYRYWEADKAYSDGSNLHKGGSYQNAYPFLVKAVSLKTNEPIYKDELSLNMGTLAAAFYLQKDASSAAMLKEQSIALNDEVIGKHPNNIVFWKNRVRLFYTLAQGDQSNEKIYYDQALESIKKAQELAPNDAKVSYNLGVLLGQTGDIEKAVEVLENTVKLKADYRDAYYALGLFYRELATDDNDFVTDPAMQQKAVSTYEYILKNIDPEDKQVKKSLESWK